jgi:hypothetical protein
MTPFETLQADFARAVRDPARPVPRGVHARNADTPVKRFAVYRNNVMVGLIDALRKRFPATERIVGGEFFIALARAFISAHPPDSPLLMFFGERLPAFIESFAPASELPWLADVARIECARTRAYHAADAELTDLARLLSSAPDRIFGARLVLHPALQLVRSRFPAVTIWTFNAGPDVEATAVDFDQPEDALVTRPQLDVTVARLPPGGATLVEALRTMPFGEAANVAAAADPDFDLTAALAFLIGRGAFAGFHMQGQTYDGSSG